MMKSKVTYRQQYTRCGKQRCRKCREGPGHGPYWYAYWHEKGRTVSKYIGTHLPEEISSQRSAGDAEKVSASHVTTQSSALPLLRIYLLGQFRIERKIRGEWRSDEGRHWHRRRARSLLGCLLSSPGRRLSREQIMEQLWPDLSIDVAANRLNGAVHELRQILEPDNPRPAASRLLRLEHDILELADHSQIWVDAEAFEQLIQAANASTDANRTLSLLEEATALYRGSYLLEELYSEWAIPRRDALQRAWVGLLLRLADLRADQKNYSGAIEILDRLRIAEPTNETALQRLMLLLTRLDRRGEALHAYQQHVAMLKRDYDGEPFPETVRLYEQLRRGLTPFADTSHTSASPASPASPVTANTPPATSGEPTPAQPALPVSSPSPNPSPTTSASAPETPELVFSFTRPNCQIGRPNQSQLIGRDEELALMRRVLLETESAIGNPQVDRPDRPSRTTQPLSFLSFSPTTTATRARRTAFLLLTGEPGIGKTRLAEELSLEAYARGWAVAWSRTYEQEGNIPYHLWTDLLRTLLQNTSTLKELFTSSPASETPSELPTLPFKVERLGVILPEFTTRSGTAALSAGTAVPVLHEQERLHLWEATLGLLSMLSQIYPLLFVLDDLHWADDSSIELLTYLTHHLQDQRILFVGTCRDGELPRPHKLRTLITDLQREQAIVTLPVQPLSQSEIGTLVSHLPAESVESIQQQAAGNPFFAEELARYEAGTTGTTFPGEYALTQQIPDAHNRQTPRSKQAAKAEASIPQGIPHPASPLPEPVAAVLERRLSRLSAGCQALLSRAAVLGGSFELNQLLSMAAASDEETVFDLLEEAIQAGLLSEEDSGPPIIYHFLHPLIINHLYSRISAARRMQLHRRAAEAIRIASPSSQQERAAAIVYHLSRGGGDPQSIAFYAELAGNRAYSIAAYSEARRYYLQAVQALLGHPLYKPEHADAQSIIRTLDTHSLSQISTSNPLSLCRILEHIAECCKILGNFEEARLLYACLLDLRSSRSFQQYLIHTDTAHEITQRHEAQVQALLWREIGHTWTSIGEYARAYECYEHGRRVMEQAGVSSGTAWACLHMAYGDMLRLEGRYLEARRYLEEALAELEIELHANQPEPASLAHKEPQTRTERALLGDPLEVGYGYERLGIAVASSGQLSDALQYMHTALKIYEQSELMSDMARICGNLGVVHVLRGEQDEARTFMHRSLSLAERTGDLPNQSFVMGNLGEVAHRSGDLLEAERWLKQSLLIAEHINDRERLSIYSADLAVTQQDLGKMQEAKASVLRAIRLGRAVRNPRVIRYALVRLGDLRIIEAMLACQFQLPDIFDTLATASPILPDPRLLRRAQHILQRAITLEGREIDNAIEGKHLLATVYYLRGEFEVAQALAQQTLKAAQEQEAIRSIGRIYRLLGRIFAARQNHMQAIHHLEQARRLFLERTLWLDYARTLHSLGITQLRWCLAHSGDQQHKPQTEPLQSDDQLYQQGLAYLQEARAIFTRSHAALDLAWIDQTLASIEAYSAQKHLRSLPI